MTPTLATFLFELINFLLLVSLLGWLLFKPVRAALQARKDAEKQRRDELAARVADAERQEAEIQQRIRAFETEMAAMRQQHLAAATQETAEIRRQAHEAAERERDAARQGLAQLERAQLERLSAAVAVVTRQSVTRLLATLDAPDLDMSLVRAACSRLAVLNDTRGTVLVESAHPLDETARSALAAALDGNTQTTEFRVAPDLGVGLRIVTSRGLIDASGRGLAREAEQALTNALAVESSEVAR